MTAIDRYLSNLRSLLTKLSRNHESLEAAAQLIAKSIAKMD